MSYQVLARKYRPQRFDEVVGQQGVTQTLANAIAGGRLAQSYIFAGARGVGKTTTARILAKALNCVQGPRVDPCGQCDACVEIAEGRDIDVIEIDAATHTQVDTVREVIISGLGVRPVRDRYKIFIIDEVHQLSGHSFNALLKSIEEPPPHVVFMMATTELHKIPDTVRSRSQEFEFRTIGTKAITEQLQKIAVAEGLQVDPTALALVARSAEGSMRDAESSLDQVIAFAGETITAADVITVLGLVGRDLLLDIVETVANEDAARVFDLTARAVESGQDLKLVCRDLARVVRDMLLVGIDPARAAEPDFAPEGDVERLTELAACFSREDLLRAFDVIARAEFEVRTSAQPRYHLEMALLKWIHLRKLQPISELLHELGHAGRNAAGGPTSTPRRAPAPDTSARAQAGGPTPRLNPPLAPSGVAAPASRVRTSESAAGMARGPSRSAAAPTVAENPPVAQAGAEIQPQNFKERFAEEIRKHKKLLHGTVVAQAQRIEVEGDVVAFFYGAQHRILRRQLEENRGALEQIAAAVAGRPMSVRAVETDGAPAAAPKTESAVDPKAQLKERALAENAVQAMLDVFPAEIRDVEEIEQ